MTVTVPVTVTVTVPVTGMVTVTVTGMVPVTVTVTDMVSVTVTATGMVTVMAMMRRLTPTLRCQLPPELSQRRKERCKELCKLQLWVQGTCRISPPREQARRSVL